MKRNKRFLISVIGAHKADKKTEKLAYEAGKMIAGLNAVLICGGLSGVMEAAACGAKDGGGLTVGILPGKSKEDANEYIDIAVATGLGYARNALVAGAADLVIAFAGKEGTLSEIGFALSEKKPVIGLHTWDIPGIIKAKSVYDARMKIIKIFKLKV